MLYGSQGFFLINRISWMSFRVPIFKMLVESEKGHPTPDQSNPNQLNNCNSIN